MFTVFKSLHSPSSENKIQETLVSASLSNRGLIPHFHELWLKCDPCHGGCPLHLIRLICYELVTHAAGLLTTLESSQKFLGQIRSRNETNTVRQLQRSLYRKARQDQEIKFYSLYDKVYREDILWEAWRQVKANQGAPGVDGETLEAIVRAHREGEMVQRLQRELQAKTYQFQAVRRVDIPKPQGGTRPLGIRRFKTE